MRIIWSNHKAGFVRRQNAVYRRQPLLNTVFTVTSEAPTPPPVIPGIPGPVRILTPWAAGQFWIMPDLTVTQRARVWLNRVTGFEARIGTLEDELNIIDALLITIQANIATNAVNIAINTAAIATLEDTSQDIVEVNAAYQVLPANKIINCLGTFTVTLPNFADATTSTITITSVSGTITVAADVSIQGSPVTITTGSSDTFYPARGQWFRS